MKLLKNVKLWRAISAMVFVFSAFLPILLAQSQAPPVAVLPARQPIVDTTAPIPGWSILTFVSMWVFTVLGYRLQFRKYKSEQENQKKQDAKDFAQMISDNCQKYFEDENTKLKLERLIGNIAERVSKGQIEKRVQEDLVTGKDLSLISKDIENMRLQLKNEMLKEVIVLMSTKMVGGSKL